MKQEITKKQWDELSDKQKDKYNKIFKEMYNGGKNVPSDITVELPNIGRMIEFLGDDIDRIEVNKVAGGYGIFFTKDGHDLFDRELVNVSWKAVKYKLLNKQ